MQSSDLQKVILVGGPTLSHLFRTKISNTLIVLKLIQALIPLRLQLGCYFCIHQKAPADFQQRDMAKAQLDIECPDTSVEEEEPVQLCLTGMPQRRITGKIFVEMANQDGSWQSPRSEMQNDADVVMVNLNQGKQNVFSISLLMKPETGYRVSPQVLVFFKA